MGTPRALGWLGALALLSLAGLACAPRAAIVGDGRDGGADAGSSSRGSYDLMAALILDGAFGPQGPIGAGKPVPTGSFTVAFDPTGLRAIVGGGAEAGVVDFVSTDGKTFEVRASFGVGIAAHACDAPVRVFFDSLELTIADGVVKGKGTGNANLLLTSSSSAVDMTMSVHFSATITGAADTTAPFLRVPPGAAISDPLTPFVLWASEPLSAGSTATLVGSDGSRVSLVPQLVPGDVPVVVAFSKPAVVLEPGLGYGVDFSGITDLAGNQAAADSTLRFASFDAAPLAPPDGFESATGASVGGAVLVRTGPGIPISGMASAYIGQFNSPAPDVSMPPRPRLTVRLAVPPGATKLAFSYRQLAEGTPGFVEVGSVGRAPTAAAAVPSLMASEFSLVGWGKEQFDESSVATAEVPLPSDVDGEVVVGFQSPPVGCNAGFGTPGLLLDDLRLE